MSVLPLRPIVGSPATGEQFFGREPELEHLLELIRGGQSVLLAAPRRIGKTSLLRAAEDRLQGELRCVFVDLESCATVEEAIASISEEASRHHDLRTRVAGWLRDVAAHTELGGGPLSIHLPELLHVGWQRQGEQLLDGLLQEGPGVVLFLDELPILVRCLLDQKREGAARSPADLFLSWLRRQTQRHGGRLRLVLTGSIGLGPMVARAGLSATLNAYYPLELAPWPDPVARQALRRLSAYTGLALSEEGAARALELLGLGLPYPVQLYHDALSTWSRRTGRPVGPTEAQEVWDTELLQKASTELAHWEQRLRKAMPEDERLLAMRLLTEAACTDALTPEAASRLHRFGEPDDTLKAVVEQLETEGFLARRTEGWYFPNRLLRAWWVRMHGPWRIPPSPEG